MPGRPSFANGAVRLAISLPIGAIGWIAAQEFLGEIDTIEPPEIVGTDDPHWWLIDDIASPGRLLGGSLVGRVDERNSRRGQYAVPLRG